jgi:hypothetical protein
MNETAESVLAVAKTFHHAMWPMEAWTEAPMVHVTEALMSAVAYVRMGSRAPWLFLAVETFKRLQERKQAPQRTLSVVPTSV